MKKIIFITKIFIILFFITIIFILGLYVYAFITPKFNINTVDSINYFDSNGNSLFNSKEKNYTKLENISDNVKNAIISIEDKNFYHHNGFDYLRIIKAMLVNISSMEIKQGASTISQQYVKNLFLSFNKTWKRKIKEAFLTIELETHYSKDEILEGYLNTIDFGAGNYGIKEASNYYFNKEPSELTLEEASILVGIPKSPSYYNPITHFDNAKKRQKDVLYSMYKNKYITKDDINKIYNREITFYGKYNKPELSSIYYYKDAVINELKDLNMINDSLISMDGLNIITNLDLEAQKILENNVNEEMKDTSMQVSSIIVEPKTSKIVALIGGKDYVLSQYNRASHSKRQVGSTIKPFLYYAALENGFTPSSTFLSERTTFNLGDNLYSPSNANNIYANKNITMLLAIAYSDNIYAMKTHLFLGENTLSDTMKRVHIKEPIKQVASSALGTSEINIIDYSNGFITLANEGIHNEAHLIEKILDNNGNTIYEYEYKNEPILNNKYVFILNNLLTSTYDYNLVSYTSPTLLSISSILDSKYAVKSGSTGNDYWTVGYNPDYLQLVWTGNDDNSKVLSKDSKIAKRIWAKTITSLPKNTKSWYEIPDDITLDTIDPYTGEEKIKGYICYYEKGSEPSYNKIDFYEKINN